MNIKPGYYLLTRKDALVARYVIAKGVDFQTPSFVEALGRGEFSELSKVIFAKRDEADAQGWLTTVVHVLAENIPATPVCAKVSEPTRCQFCFRRICVCQ